MKEKKNPYTAQGTTNSRFPFGPSNHSFLERDNACGYNVPSFTLSHKEGQPQLSVRREEGLTLAESINSRDPTLVFLSYHHLGAGGQPRL